MANDLSLQFLDSGDDSTDARARLQAKWEEARAAYAAAGAPFGPTPRGLEVWIEFGRITTGQ